MSVPLTTAMKVKLLYEEKLILAIVFEWRLWAGRWRLADVTNPRVLVET